MPLSALVKSEKALHKIAPIYDENSRILILGSFPSVKSREANFFYHHPQNRFWKVLASVLEIPVPETVEEKKAMLLRGRIAVWDVAGSCTINGSSDNSIRDVVPNRVDEILVKAPIQVIYTNGATAHRLYGKYLEPVLKRKAVKLPSTSPANASWSLERLKEAWSVCRLSLNGFDLTKAEEESRIVIQRFKEEMP